VKRGKKNEKTTGTIVEKKVLRKHLAMSDKKFMSRQPTTTKVGRNIGE